MRHFSKLSQYLVASIWLALMIFALRSVPAGAENAQSTSFPTQTVSPVKLFVEGIRPGQWGEWGKPWNVLAFDATGAKIRQPCNRPFSAILSTWSGWAWNGGRYFYIVASGGHGDGCDNGVYRYDIETGTPEIFVPHKPPNADLIDANGEVVTNSRRTCRVVADANGDQNWPGSHHIYEGAEAVGDYIYMYVHAIFPGCPNRGVWRFHVPSGEMAKLPSKNLPRNSSPVSLLARPGAKPGDRLLMFGRRGLCEADLENDIYENCRHRGIRFTTHTSIRYDIERKGIWHIAGGKKRQKLTPMKIQFIRDTHSADGSRAFAPYVELESETTHFERGSPGLCLAPTPTGRVPIVWWGEGALAFNGADWIDLSNSTQPDKKELRGKSYKSIYKKWAWNASLGVCMGTRATVDGLFFYKPPKDLRWVGPPIGARVSKRDVRLRERSGPSADQPSPIRSLAPNSDVVGKPKGSNPEADQPSPKRSLVPGEFLVPDSKLKSIVKSGRNRAESFPDFGSK